MAFGQFPSANTAETTAKYHKRKREAIDRDSGPSVYELSKLQVDPYGLRVGSNSRPLQRPELDLRGNLIAYDAPRPSYVAPKPQRDALARVSDRPVPFGNAQAAAVDDEEERSDEGSERPDVKLERDKNRGASVARGGRPRRQGSSTRSKFDFWDATTEVYEEPLLPKPSISGSPSSSSTPPPSADLINAIVHFSAEHYIERGQLHSKWPIPTPVLVRHRSKRTIRSRRRTKETSSDSESEPSENEAGTSKGEADKGKAKEAPPGHDPKESIVGYSSISMHRAFDGTAANAIGMIVQELIRENIHAWASPGASGTTGSQGTAKRRKKRSTASRYVSPTRTLAQRRMAESELAAQESDQEDSERERGETEPEADMVDRDVAEAGATRKHLTRQSKIGKGRVRAGENAESDDEAPPTRASRRDPSKRREKTNTSRRRVSGPATSEDDRAVLGEGDDDEDDEEMGLA